MFLVYHLGVVTLEARNAADFFTQKLIALAQNSTLEYWAPRSRLTRARVEGTLAAMAKTKGLPATLARIDALLTVVSPNNGATLSPPAKDASITRLKKALPVPDEVVTLFHWHDGQKKPAQLHPEDNRVLLSVAGALDAWKFLGDPSEEILQPWSKSWLPLLSNGAGDYVCVETAGKKRGQLVTYYHDDKTRPVAWPSLAAWAGDLAGALEKAAKKPKPAASVRVVIDASQAKWKKSKRPREAQLDKLAPGAVVWWPRMITSNGVAFTPGALLYLKVEKGEKPWRFAKGADPAAALAKLQSYLDGPRRPDDGNWKADSHTVAFYAKEDCYDDLADDPVPVDVHEGAVVLKGG